MRAQCFPVAIGLALLLTLVGSSPGSIPPAEAALSRPTIRRVMRSVVQIIAVDMAREGQAIAKWGGSGTIVSQDGLVLTNCHVALPRAMIDDPQFDYDALVVSLTTRSDEPPTPTYQAEVVQCDPDLDLAVIQIVKAVDGTSVDPAKLNLPAVPLGDSDQVEIGDPLFIFGYPGIGGETITFTAGNVSGFTSERGVTGRAWIKTDTTVAGGNSGGAAINEEGELIGVPTRIGAGNTKEKVDCRPVADTNNDGDIDAKDTCVPVGGFINALRPVNLAKSVIRAAGRGLGKPTLKPRPLPEPKARKEGARVSRLIFAPAVDDYDQPVTVADSFPSGTEDIYLFFDYEEFQDGVPWSAELIYENGTYTDTWPMTSWDGGPSGSWWIGYGGQVLDDGTYEFILYYDNEEIGSAEVEVGGPERRLPTFSNIEFSGGGESGYLLPAGVKELKATFEFANMTGRTEWSNVWYYEGKDILREDGEPLPTASGTYFLELSKGAGFDPGRYRLELYIGDRLAATSDFLMVGEKEPDRKKEERPQALFGPITFASRVDRDDNPVDPGTSFPSGIGTLYGIFDYQGMQDGWEWTQRWFLDGEVVADTSEAWELGEQGENVHVSIYSRAGELPDGEYRLELLVQGQPVQSGVATIGGGRGRPTPTPAPRTGVEIFGYITDADTGWGIAGALFLVLQPGITINEFQWTEKEVYAWGETDRRGYYELSAPLIRGQSYSMLVGAPGYRRIAEDGVSIPENLESPLRLNLELQRAR